MSSSPGRWLLLIHQLPATPSHLRVKTWRRLQSAGAVALKNSVYVLPDNPETREDFEWIVREIHAEGGEAALCQAALLEGTTDSQLEATFIDVREKDYRDLAEEIRGAIASGEVTPTSISRLRKRFREIVSLDFFHAPGREPAGGLLREAEGLLEGESKRSKIVSKSKWKGTRVEGRRWVTRKGIRIDRIASAWLIRRYIDPRAAFEFVKLDDYSPAEWDLRFDMFEAEFTHDGDLCTFEVLLREFAITEPGLRQIAEIVHDIDLKDSRYGRPETSGIAHLVLGIAGRHEDDDVARLAEGSAVFDALQCYLAQEQR
jgi:hypothetical protein